MENGYNNNTFTEKYAAQYISMSVPFLRHSRMDGIRKNRPPGPPFVKIGRSVRYLKTDLDHWLQMHRVELHFAGGDDE